MKKRTLILRYYKRKFNHGRTLVARAVDFTALRIITLAACYLWFSTLTDNTLIAAVLSFTALLTISISIELVKSIRFDRFVAMERKRVAERLFRERLLILPKEEFLAIVKAYLEGQAADFVGDTLVYPVRTAAPVDADTVLKAYRAAQKRGLAAAVVFSASPVLPGARRLAERYNEVTMTFVTPDDLIASKAAAGFMPGDDAVEEAILAAIQAEKAGRKRNASSPFASGRLRRYVLVAVALFALSFFVKYTLYYRLLSAACLSFGALAWWLNAMTAASDPSSAV